MTVAQVRHEFGFGCTAPGAPDSALLTWLDLFDTATLPFYWGRYEPEPGRTSLVARIEGSVILVGMPAKDAVITLPAISAVFSQ